MVRSVLGVVVGAVVWMALFLLLGFSLAAVWQDYGLHGRNWFQARIYDFTPAMSVCNALIWILAEIGAGWLAVVLARRREAAWVLAALIGVYLAYLHLYQEWANLPWWYNLAVAIPAAPAVLCGGRLAGRFAAPRAAVTVG
jgi:hypothetical protein